MFNPGKFVGKEYIKEVSFSKAVLWKDRQISLNTSITSQFKTRGIERVAFVDAKKGERWEATVEELRKVKIYKREGQEEQFYFPISVFKIKKLKGVPEPEKSEADKLFDEM